jgi:hypothetical protein
MYSLNDLEKVAISNGVTKNISPSEWMKLQVTQEAIDILIHENPAIKIIETKAGRYGGTFACKELVYAYAMWVSADFLIHVIRAYDAMHSASNEEQTRLRDRQTARLECHDLKKAIEDRYTRRGTKPATYNFSNEFNMINKIVLGETAKKFKESHGLDPNAMLRDYLSAIEIKAVLDLQATSRVLCDLDFNYDQRKEKLTKLFDQKYRDAMLAEIIRLES